MPTLTHIVNELRDPRWSRVHKIQLIRREVREFLSVSAIGALFSRAEHRLEDGLYAEDGLHASVTVALDLGAFSDVFRERADPATALRVAALMEGDRAVHRQILSMIRTELAALACLDARSAQIELEFQVRAEGRTVFVDGDAVVSLAKIAGAHQ